MPDDLDPKLRELEANLRRLKPLEVKRAGGVAERSLRVNPQVSRSTATLAALWRATAALWVATAAIILLIVCLIPQRQPPVLPPISETANLLPSAVRRLPSNTMREQLAELLDEMTVADAVAERKPVYPVVEIVVQNTPLPRTATSPFGRWRFDEEMMTMF